MPVSGKLYGRFLGSRANVAYRRVYFVPHIELSSAASASPHPCVIPDKLQRGPGKDSAKLPVWQGRRGLASTMGYEYQEEEL